MTETRINISELKSEGSDVVRELAEFLEEKTNAKIEIGTTEMIVKEKGEEKTISRQYLRVLLRKFLHKKELKDYFRVISDKENVLTVKEKKITEEQD